MRSVAALNSVLLLVIGDLARSSGSGSVTIRADSVTRALHVSRGSLVGADSNVDSERLGPLLAAEGRLDPALIEPMAAAARARNVLLGEQLVADGLLSVSEVTAAMERQSRMRFALTLATPGTVKVEPLVPGQRLTQLALGATLVELFRTGFDLDALGELIVHREPQSQALDPAEPLFQKLRLIPAEAKIAQRLISGDSLDDLFEGTGSPEQVMRLAASLVALGLWA